MAVFAATDFAITLGTTNLSANLVQAELALESEELDTTAFGSTWRTRTGGLKNASLTLQFNQDFGAGSVDSLLGTAALGSLIAFNITPTSSAVSATNPKYAGSALVVQYSPFSSSVGDLATFSVTWPVSGAVTRATA